MSRPALVALLVCALPAAAQPLDPLLLVRGLRDRGMPDFALDYLDKVEHDNPPAAVRAVLPLERARCRLELANDETDEGQRDRHVSRAAAEFAQFLTDHPKHSRAAEAALALARVKAVVARAQLARAGKIDAGTDDGKARRKAEQARTRPAFRDTAAQFGRVSKQIADQLADETLDPARKRDLTRDRLLAELDRGVNLFRLADTYAGATLPAEVKERAQALDDAKRVFDPLGRGDPTSPVCWVAKAWAAECEIAKTNRPDADELLREIRTEAAKNPAAQEGLRMSEFFDLTRRYLAAGTPQQFANTRAAIDAWLGKWEPGRRPNPERLSLQYYKAYLGFLDAVRDPAVGYADKERRQPKAVGPSARAKLEQAARELKRLAETDSEYSDRAARYRTEAVRLVVLADGERPPAEYADFERCQMAALYHLDKAARPDDPAAPADRRARDRADRLGKAAALFERCRDLVTPAVSPKDAADAQLLLVHTYALADRPFEAAVLGEHLARSARSAGAASKAGVLAVRAYTQAAERTSQLDPTQAAAAGRADHDRAVALARHLDRTYRTDGAADPVRHTLGGLLLQAGQNKESFDTLTRLTPGYPDLLRGRLLEAAAAFNLLKKDSPLPAEEKAAVLRRAAADAEAVPEPPPAAEPDDARAFVTLRTRLAQLHLTDAPAGYPRAERTAAAAARTAAAFGNLSDAERAALAHTADLIRLVAVQGQVQELKKGKEPAKAVLAKLAPLLAEVARAGPAAKPGADATDPAARLDAARRELAVEALQVRIRDGAVTEAADLLTLLDRLGGRPEVVAATLARLVQSVRPQIDELRKANRAEEADRTAATLTDMMLRAAGKPNLPPAAVFALGQSLRQLGSTDKAVDLLAKIPAPPEADLKAAAGQLDPARAAAVEAYKAARLELVRAYTQAKRFDDAGRELVAALGEKDKPGWTRSLAFRKEANFLLEARAAADPAPAERSKLYFQALQGWQGLLGEVTAAFRAPLPADEDRRNDEARRRESLKPLFMDLQYEYQRAAARANAAVLGGKNPAKLAERLAKAGEFLARDLEARYKDVFTPELRERFAALLDEFPEMRKAYRQAGGREFLRDGAEAKSN